MKTPSSENAAGSEPSLGPAVRPTLALSLDRPPPAKFASTSTLDKNTPEGPMATLPAYWNPSAVSEPFSTVAAAPKPVVAPGKGRYAVAFADHRS